MPAFLDFGDDRPNMDAARQQLMFVEAVYADRRDVINAYLGASGAVVAGENLIGTWLPSWMLVRTGPRDYFISVEGTTSWYQGFSEITGAWARPFEANKWYANGTFLEAADNIITRSRPYLPADLDGVRLRLCGHSYGGAVAFLMAWRYKSLAVPPVVQVMTFGAPRSVSSGFHGPYPNSNWRFESSLDPVPELPPFIPLPVVQSWSFPVRWDRVFVPWYPQGAGMILQADGRVGGDYADPKPLPDDVIVDIPAVHNIGNYYGRLRENYVRFGGDPTSQVALNATRDMLQGMPVRLLTQRLPEWMKGPDGELTKIPSLADLVRAQMKGGGGVGVYKHTWVFNDQDGAQWSEVHTIGSGADARSSLDAIPSALIDARLAFLWAGDRLRMIRASEIGGSRTSNFRIVNLQGAQGTTTSATEGPDVTAAAAVYELQCLSGARRKIWFRGLVDASISRTPGTGKDKVGAVAGPAIDAFIAAAAAFGYGVIARTKPNVLANTDYRWAGIIDGTPGNGVTILNIGDATGYARGMFISVSLADRKRLPGLNAIFQIQAVNLGTGAVTIWYRTPNNVPYNDTGARVRLLVPQTVSAYMPTRCVFDHFGTRQTKGLFTGSRGARRVVRLRNLA